MIKKLVKTYLILSLLVTFTGCGAGVSLSDRVIVKMVYIDTTSTGYTAGVAVNICEPSADTVGGENKIEIYFGEGETVGDAIFDATSNQNNKPFYAQNEILLLGENTHGDISNVLPYFTKEDASRPSMAVFVSDITKKDLKKEKDLTKVIQSIEGVLDNKDKTMDYTKMIYECNFVDDEFQGYLPKIKLKESECLVDGLSIFTDGEKQLTLGTDKAELAMLLLTKADSYRLTGELNGEKYQGDIINVKRKTFTEKTGKPCVIIEITGAVRNLSYEDSLQLISVAETQEIEKQVNDNLSEAGQKLVDEINTITPSDMFGTMWWAELHDFPKNTPTKIVFEISFI